MTWEEQRDEIERLNALCLEQAKEIIEGKSEIIKGYTKAGNGQAPEPIYITILDGVDLLSRCSSIAKQWTTELRHEKPKDGTKPGEVDPEKLKRKARHAE